MFVKRKFQSILLHRRCTPLSDKEWGRRIFDLLDIGSSFCLWNQLLLAESPQITSYCLEYISEMFPVWLSTNNIAEHPVHDTIFCLELQLQWRMIIITHSVCHFSFGMSLGHLVCFWKLVFSPLTLPKHALLIQVLGVSLGFPYFRRLWLPVL